MGQEDQKKLAKRPKIPQEWQNLRPKAKHRTRPKRSARDIPGSHSQWPPRSGRGGCPRPWWSVFARLCRFPFACLFVFWRFLLFSFFKLPCIWTFQRNPIHSIAIFSIRVSLEFLERERKKDEELQGFCIGLGDRKTGARIWMSFCSSSLLFSQSKFMFCYFVLNL